jgi:hypothetical protein
MEFETTIDCPVKRDFAWKFWTDVSNWPVVDPSAESVELHGPFAAGSTGRTKPAGSDSIDWKLIDVQDGTSAVVQIDLPEAQVRFHWTFEDSQTGTRMTQRVTIEGDHADNYREGFEALRAGVPAGMKKLADAMVREAKQDS